MATRDLSLEEIEELSESAASGILLPTDVEPGTPLQYTEADLALLEQEEGFSTDVDTDDFSNVPGTMTKLLRTPAGKPLKVEMIDNAVSSDTVNLYDARTGQPYPIARANIRFYLNKVRDDGSKVFSTRPLVALPARPYECQAEMCLARGQKKAFPTAQMRDEHFRNRHQGEYRRREEARELEEREEARTMNKSLAAVMTLIASGKTNVTPEDVAAITAAQIEAGMKSGINLKTPRSKILAWMEAKGIPYTNERASMRTAELLVDIGALDAEEAGLEMANV